MAKSYTMTVTDAGDPEEVRALTVCQSILFGEDAGVAGWPTVDWEYRRSPTDNWISKTAGTSQIFKHPGGGSFEPGQLIAEVQVKSGQGTSTFGQHEE